MEGSKDNKRSDEASYIAHMSQNIIDTIYCRDYDRAVNLIASAREKIPETEMHRLVALTAVLRERTGNLPEAIELMREAQSQSPTWLPHLHRLADYLMEAEEWFDADVVLDELISLSEMKGDAYFLDDARIRKILCLKNLGREGEIELQKSKISAGTETFIGGKVICVDDL